MKDDVMIDDSSHKWLMKLSKRWRNLYLFFPRGWLFSRVNVQTGMQQQRSRTPEQRAFQWNAIHSLRQDYDTHKELWY